MTHGKIHSVQAVNQKYFTVLQISPPSGHHAAWFPAIGTAVVLPVPSCQSHVSQPLCVASALRHVLLDVHLAFKLFIPFVITKERKHIIVIRNHTHLVLWVMATEHCVLGDKNGDFFVRGYQQNLRPFSFHVQLQLAPPSHQQLSGGGSAGLFG